MAKEYQNKKHHQMKLKDWVWHYCESISGGTQVMGKWVEDVIAELSWWSCAWVRANLLLQQKPWKKGKENDPYGMRLRYFQRWSRSFWRKIATSFWTVPSVFFPHVLFTVWPLTHRTDTTTEWPCSVCSCVRARASIILLWSVLKHAALRLTPEDNWYLWFQMQSHFLF